MKIYTRAPRIKIGNTTYRFGKNGVSRSTKIAKGIRIGTTSSGKRYISGGRGIFRFYQDLDELNYDSKNGNLQNQNPFNKNGNQLTPAEQQQRKQQIDQLRNQRKNDLSFGLLLTHPFVFFDHLFRKNKQKTQVSQTSNPIPISNQSQSNNQPSNIVQSFSIDVDIYKEDSSGYHKVTNGTVFLDNLKIVIKANVTKEILYTDILDIHIEMEKVFISSKGRTIPLIIQMKNPNEFLEEITNRISK